MTVTHADMVQMWSESGVRTFPVEHLEGLRLPEAAREALGAVGIPVETPVLFTATTLEETSLKGVGEAVRFGHAWHDEYNLCIAIPDGRIFAAHRFQREITFVNRDALTYLEFLLRVAKMYQMFDAVADGGIPESVYLDAVAQTQQAAQELDPEAVAEGSWWTGVIEELKLV